MSFYFTFLQVHPHELERIGCWIEKPFKTEQVVTEYLWVWTAGVVMAILYTIMFVVIRGWFIIDNGVHWYKNYKPSYPNAPEVETDEEKQTKAIANLMLLYVFDLRLQS